MNPKAFQKATIDHVMAAIASGSSRRFLVADEVGLGKTRVAQGVIERLIAQRPSKPLQVFYVCSSLSIVHQNRDALLEVLDTEREREAARISVDRLTLLPDSEPADDCPTRLKLYTLTPGTLPKGKSTGRVDERALAWRLLCSAVDGLRRYTTLEDIFKNKVGHWNPFQDARPGEEGLARRFRHRLAWRLLPNRDQVDPQVRCFDATFINRMRAFADREHGGRDLIVEARIALAESALENLDPHLVIFDEFQRFFETLVPDDEDRDQTAHDLVDRLLGSGSSRKPIVLMLSATPYRLYSEWTEGIHQHYEQFYKLLEFLFAGEHGEVIPKLKERFHQYREMLQQAPIDSPALLEVRDRIQSDLARVICRTERPRGPHSEQRKFTVTPAPLAAQDVRMLRYIHDSARQRDRFQSVPYWSSIPFAMQAMDNGYLFASKAKLATLEGDARALVLRRKAVSRFESIGHPHPRLRALLRDTPPASLALPWMPPTVRWWPLGGVFAEATKAAASGLPPSKVILFSRFRAVPRSVAAILSYEAERQCFSPLQQKARGTKPVAYEYRTLPQTQPKAGLKRRPRTSLTFPKTKVDTSLRSLIMFWPLPRLAALGDPMALDVRSRASMNDALAAVERRLSAEAGWSDDLAVDGQLTTAAAAALLEQRTPRTWAELVLSFTEPPRQGHPQEDSDVSGLAAAIKSFRGTKETSKRPRPQVLRELAEIALLGPANVLLRTVRRIFDLPASGEAKRLSAVAAVALRGLRTYLDLPDFHALLRTRHRRTHPEAVRQAIWDGNFEAVLDEHLAVLRGLGVDEVPRDVEGKVLERLTKALTLGVGVVSFRDTGNGEPLRIRCHAAIPFGLSSDDREPGSGELHSDGVRIAFNSPFRPHVLATTSIGQEGLDFHVWCNHIVHWDLPSNPVDLEQRDGRVNRYAGLAIRRALADRCEPSSGDASPWLALGRSIEPSNGGLSPWWVTKGGDINRTVYAPPFSKITTELDDLLAKLSLYRMALGQSDQESLIDALHRRLKKSGGDREALERWLDHARIDLRPRGGR